MIQYIQIACKADRFSEVVGQTYKIFLDFLLKKQYVLYRDSE